MSAYLAPIADEEVAMPLTLWQAWTLFYRDTVYGSGIRRRWPYRIACLQYSLGVAERWNLDIDEDLMNDEPLEACARILDMP